MANQMRNKLSMCIVLCTGTKIPDVRPRQNEAFSFRIRLKTLSFSNQNAIFI